MDVLMNKKAKRALTRMVQESLAAALSSTGITSVGLSAKMVAAVSGELVDHLMVDVRFLDCVSTLIAPATSEFLTTEEAARLSRLSRPCLIALLDGPLYPGVVSRTPQGLRRVLRSEFVAWLATVSFPKDVPRTIKEVRSGPRDDDPVASDEMAAQQAERMAAKERSIAYARSKGLF